MDQQQQQAVGQLIPSAGAANWFSQFLNGLSNSGNRQQTPNSQAVAQQQAAQLRRQRVIAQLQQNAQASGRAPLSQNELDEALHSYGLQ